MPAAPSGTGLSILIFWHMAGYDPSARTRLGGLYRFFHDHASNHDPDLMVCLQIANRAGGTAT